MRLSGNIERIIDSMPSLPITVAKITEITKNPSSTPADLNKVITLDPVLTAKVLKLVNSAYYGISNGVTSIVKAIILLGLNTIKNLAVSTAILGTMKTKGKTSTLDMDGFWRHCLAVGVTSRSIAVKIGIDPKLREEFFIAGMLHDIGKIVINEHFAAQYLQIIQSADSKRVSLWKEESAVFDIDHAGTGKLIADKWSLTQSLAEVISFHHRPLESSQENRTLVTAVAAADMFCVENATGFAGNRTPDILSDESWKTLGLIEEDLFGIEETINEEIMKASIFLTMGG
ncbi:MAG: HDOD domain-containing protein [Spirochaetota bacterium]|nr:HDOD domain-containing protein [Spirochaetota bacterium]